MLVLIKFSLAKYAMFINNNHALFHLQWKENLVKHQKVLKYYEMIVENKLTSFKKNELYMTKTRK